MIVSELAYKNRMELIYKKSHQVYKGILVEEEAEINEGIDQLDREIDKLSRRTEAVDPQGCENAQAVGVRAEIVGEDVAGVDPNSVLDMDFDEEDPKEDPEDNFKEDSEEDLEEYSERDPEEEAKEFYENNPKGIYNADMEGEAAIREDIMSKSDSDILMWGREPPEQEDIMSESGSEIIMLEERPPKPKIFELIDSEEQLDMSDSLPVETSADSESTFSDDSGDADFDPDVYEDDRDRMDASPFAK